MTSQDQGRVQEDRDPEGGSSPGSGKTGKTEADPTNAPIGSGWSGGDKPGQLPTGEPQAGERATSDEEK